jgi:ketosteroid isomerase-like protein
VCSRYRQRSSTAVSYPAGSVLVMTKAHEVVAAYWAAAEARDWNAFGALVADDVVYRGPQTREQVRGREAYVRFNADGFDYDWHVTVVQIVGEGQHAASWTDFAGREGTQPGLCWFELDDDGRIATIIWSSATDAAGWRGLSGYLLTGQSWVRHGEVTGSRQPVTWIWVHSV